MHRLTLPLVLLLILAPPVRAAAFTVTTTDDTIDVLPGDGVCADGSGACSLRAAVMEANASPGADTIDVPAGTYLFTQAGGAGDETDPSKDDLDVTEDLTINGAGAALTVINANERDRAFHVPFDSGASLTLTGLTLTNGDVDNGIMGGGAILFNGDALLLQQVSITNNEAHISGGGISSLEPAATITLIETTIRDNIAHTYGGGLISAGEMTIRRSTISGNLAWESGGGITNTEHGPAVTITASTISGNEAYDDGGGIDAYRGAAYTLTEVTVVNNTADRGGGFSLTADGVQPSITLNNTLLAVNTPAHNQCRGSLTSGGHNLLQPDSGCTPGPDDLVSTQAPGDMLGPLGDHGGATPTHTLPQTSDAIDVGQCVLADGDQRGYTRMDMPGVPNDGGNGCDIGAVEYLDNPSEVILSNGSFEEPLAGTWSLIESGGGDGRISHALAHSGDHLLLLRANGTTELIQQTAPVSGGAGDAVTLTVMVAGQNVSGGVKGAQVELLAGGVPVGLKQCLFNQSGTFNWQPFECSFTAGATFDAVRVRIGWKGVSGGLLGMDSALLSVGLP